MSLLTGPYHQWIDAGQTGGAAPSGTISVPLNGSIPGDSVSIVTPPAGVAFTPLNPAVTVVSGTPWTLRINIDALRAQYPSVYAHGAVWMAYVRCARGSHVSVERFVVNFRGTGDNEAAWLGTRAFITGPISFEVDPAAHTNALRINLTYHHPIFDAGDNSALWSVGNVLIASDASYADVVTDYEACPALPNVGLLQYKRQWVASSLTVQQDIVPLYRFATPATLPVITSGDAAGTTGSAFTYTITATGSPTSYSANALPVGLSLDGTTGVVSGVPTVAGSYSVVVRAVNGAGTGSDTVAFVIADSIAAPVVTSGDASGDTGTNFDYTITATGSPTRFAASGLPSGLTVDTTTGQISGRATAAGTYPVTLYAVNSGGAGAELVTFTITSLAGGIPVITSGNAAGVVGTPFTYAITATNTPTAFTTVGLPPGLVLDGETGIITGTPTLADVWPVVLMASNALGLTSVMRTFTSTGAGPAVGNAVIQVDLATGVATITGDSLVFRHRNQMMLEIQFTPGSLAGTITNVGFTLKEKDAVGVAQYARLLNVENAGGPKDLSGGSIFVCGPLSVSGDPLDRSLTLLDPITVALSVVYSGEVHWVWNGRARTSSFIPVTITRELHVAGFDAATPAPSVPTTGMFVYDQSITHKTGGGTSALDGKATIGVPNNYILAFVDVTQGWVIARLELDSAPLNGASVVQPFDHDSATNPRSWRFRA